MTFCKFAEKNSTAFKKKKKIKIRCQTLQACVLFLVLLLGAQNAEHKTNSVLSSTLTESKVPVSRTLHLPGSPVECVCINVANCVGFSLDAQLYLACKNYFSDFDSLQVKRL